MITNELTGYIPHPKKLEFNDSESKMVKWLIRTFERLDSNYYHLSGDVQNSLLDRCVVEIDLDSHLRIETLIKVLEHLDQSNSILSQVRDKIYIEYQSFLTFNRADSFDRTDSLTIPKYGFDSKLLGKIVFLLTVLESRALSKKIHHFNIVYEKTRIKIAKIAAKKKLNKLSKYIKNYRIQDEQARVKIAKIAASEVNNEVSEFIENYEIQNEQDRIEIAKITVKHSGEHFSQFIENFKIKNERDRIEIAKVAIAYSSECSKFIENYKIQNEQARLKIAKLAASHQGHISLFIKNYAIKSEQDRLEIAKIAAYSDSNISQYFENYAIKNEQDRIEIAKIAAVNSFYGISSWFENYKIQNEQARLKIAKLAAANSPSGISQFIKSYEIKDEQDRVEIAKIAAANSDNKISEFIKNYDIKNERDRIEIAKIAAIHNAKNTLLFFNNYLIESEKVYFEIAKKALVNSLPHPIEKPLNHKLNNCKLIYELDRIFNLTNYLGGKNKIEYTEQGFPKDYNYLFSIISENKINDAKVKEEISNWLSGLISLKEKLLEDFTEDISDNTKTPAILELFKTLRDYRDPNARKLFTSYFLLKFYLKKESAKKQFLINCFSTNKGKKKRTESIATHKKIATMLLAGICKQTSTVKKLVDSICIKKDGPWIRSVNKAIHNLCICKDINLKTKLLFLKKVSQAKGNEAKRSESISADLQLIDTVISLGYCHLLLDKKASFKSIKINLLHLFKQLFNLEGINNLESKFLNTINKFEHPFDIFSYLSSLKSKNYFEKPLVLETLNLFVREVLEGSFKNNRYDLQKNIHLSNVFKDRMDMYDIWKAGQSSCEKNLINQKGESSQSEDDFLIEDTDDPEALLRCGSDTLGSCLSLNGSPGNNIGLLGYLLNGQNRLITVRDRSGKLMGRCLLRILWEQRKQQPALFQERTYTNQKSKRVTELLNIMCEERSKKLNIPLYTSGNNPILISFGGRSPFEYVDAKGGLQKNCVYKIY